jgi:hypothetical protein
LAATRHHGAKPLTILPGTSRAGVCRFRTLRAPQMRAKIEFTKPLAGDDEPKTLGFAGVVLQLP